MQGPLIEAVATLKADASIRRIALSGSVSLVRQLLAVGLLDELHLFVHPALAGSGVRCSRTATQARENLPTQDG
jgi:dihydrofolate reductase